MQYIGNKDILQLQKTAFLCSRKIAPTAVLKCYDWATNMKQKGQCVIMGAQSPIEQDVFDILLKGEQPLVLMLARTMKKQWTTVVKSAIDDGRLLVISSFDQIRRVSRQTSLERNHEIIKMADEVVVGYLAQKSGLRKLLFGITYELI